MRTAFIKKLIELAKNDGSIFLIVGDLGFSVVEPYAIEFPERFLNVGVAEQNMTGIAAGLALEGYTVFTYSIGNFPTLRCMEQIRYDICYHNLNVKIVAVGGGYAYGSLGPSHHATEDLGMMRTLPNMIVCAPADPFETSSITELISNNKSPCYLRLGKAGEPEFHNGLLELKIGESICMHEGINTVVLTSGAILGLAIDYIKSSPESIGLYSFPFIKPIDYAALKLISSKYENIITIEEHQRSAGFGSAVLEGLHDLAEQNEIKSIPQVKRIAIPDKFTSISGDQSFLRSIANLRF